MSEFARIPSGLPPGPDFADSRRLRGVLTHKRRSLAPQDDGAGTISLETQTREPYPSAAEGGTEGMDEAKRKLAVILSADGTGYSRPKVQDEVPIARPTATRVEVVNAAGSQSN